MDLNGLRNPDFWKEYYQNVQGQLGKINTMLKDLWSVSEKPNAGFTDQVQLHRVIADTLELLKEGLMAKNIKVENRIGDSLPVMQVDQPKFCRLFELLLKDEITSLPAGSTITLTASLVPGTVSGQQDIHVQVTDNGPGLPKEALRLVFDPFMVREDSLIEYGIHLMACYFIVHHHGGRITARSGQGQGTVFSLRLPINPSLIPPMREEREFVQKVLLSENLWEKLISSD
jgi:signal transduction histidine kinase